MQSSMKNRPDINSARITRLKAAIDASKPGICTERALIWTAYNKQKENRSKAVPIQIAEALAEVLGRKTIKIHPDELIVGNFSSKRVGGSIFPELHGVPVMLDLLKFSSRSTNPLQVSKSEIWRLAKTIPYWATRFLGFKAYSSVIDKARLVSNQLKAHFYLINELGGISHFAPDYESLIKLGTEGISQKARENQTDYQKGSEEWSFLESVQIIMEGLAHFGQRYADLAAELAAIEKDLNRKGELERIAASCSKSLRAGANTFQDALQITFLTQIAINLESLDNAVCPGRMDQYLYPFYQKDLEEGRLSREEAKELVAAFCIKMSEIIPVLSHHLTRFHGGMFSGQVVTVGGLTGDGKDATNDLSFIFLEVMDELRMRQPNFHARVHKNSPSDYTEKITDLLARGTNSPAIYNDDIITETMENIGYDSSDARDYTAIGCVEPASQGKSFSSTDAALVNIPILLEMALNEGKRFNKRKREGEKTPPISQMKNMSDICSAFESQLEYMLKKLVRDLKAIEIANSRFHPTPLSSALLEGCISSATCSTNGGAKYNFSGIQCVGPMDAGDALYAIEKSVFEDNKLSLSELVQLLRSNLANNNQAAYLKNLSKFGNDQEKVDSWTNYVYDIFAEKMESFGRNTRGGPYVAGYYSVTSHEYFGEQTGALPHGRKAGEPFASGLAPVNGMDKKGPTALLNSMNRFDFRKAKNGINFNMKFDPHTLRGNPGKKALWHLLKTYFKRGGMQVQVNVIDPKMLIEARDNPDLYPNLLVRVSGYSAYFNDLSPATKEEVIRRSSLSLPN